MLPFRNRLPASDIAPLLRRGRRARSESFDLVFRESSHGPRFAVIVSTKTDKRATARNRMKRLVREALKHTIPTMSRSIDGIFVIRKRLPDHEPEVEHLVQDALARV